VLDTPTVSRPGDLWQLGQHRLYCGSALDAASYQTLLVPDRADMVFTDPPYNVPIQGHAGGRGVIKHREFEMASVK
jgi:DNA modification methylase